MQLEQIMVNQIQKDRKLSCHFWIAGSKNRVLSMPPTLNTPKGVGKHLNHPSGPTSGHILTFTPCKTSSYPTHPVISNRGSEQGNLLVVFAFSCAAGAPVKPYLNFCLACYQFLLIREGQESWSVSLRHQGNWPWCQGSEGPASSLGSITGAFLQQKLSQNTSVGPSKSHRENYGDPVSGFPSC